MNFLKHISYLLWLVVSLVEIDTILVYHAYSVISYFLLYLETRNLIFALIESILLFIFKFIFHFFFLYILYLNSKFDFYINRIYIINLILKFFH